jgi:phosphatidylglycerophosphatase A
MTTREPPSLSQSPADGANLRPGALLRHPLGWIALGLGSGLSPRAPGTFGSVTAMLIWVAFLQGSPSLPAQLAAVMLSIPICIAAADWAARRLGGKDPGCIVSDELAGQWLALLAAPPTWPWWLVVFVLFRLFDIAKPWPMRRLERLPGGIGIVVDDLMAGVYVIAIVMVIRNFVDG